MHIAQRFLPSDRDEPAAIINRLRFGTLVTQGGRGFDATPLPWVAERTADGIALWGHLARANPQLGDIDGRSCLIAFTGVHGYISPRILPTPHSAPTWNYIAVHVHGGCERLDETQTETAVEKLVHAMECTRAQPWQTTEMGPRREQLLRHVVGVRLVAERIDAKFKLGQNESDVDLAAILAQLDADGADELAGAMRGANAARLRLGEATE